MGSSSGSEGGHTLSWVSLSDGASNEADPLRTASRKDSWMEHLRTIFSTLPASARQGGEVEAPAGRSIEEEGVLCRRCCQALQDSPGAPLLVPQEGAPRLGCTDASVETDDDRFIVLPRIVADATSLFLGATTSDEEKGRPSAPREGSSTALRVTGCVQRDSTVREPSPDAKEGAGKVGGVEGVEGVEQSKLHRALGQLAISPSKGTAAIKGKESSLQESSTAPEANLPDAPPERIMAPPVAHAGPSVGQPEVFQKALQVDARASMHPPMAPAPDCTSRLPSLSPVGGGGSSAECTIVQFCDASPRRRASCAESGDDNFLCDEDTLRPARLPDGDSVLSSKATTSASTLQIEGSSVASLFPPRHSSMASPVTIVCADGNYSNWLQSRIKGGSGATATRRPMQSQARRERKIKFSNFACLLDAAFQGDFEEVRDLIDNKAMHPDSCNADGVTALHCASGIGRLDLVEFLVSRGANVNVADDHGWTPLHNAAYTSNTPIVTYLIERGADIEAVDGEGKAPLGLTSNHDIIRIIGLHLRQKNLKESVRALYDFDCGDVVDGEGNEMSFAKGDEVRIISRDDTDWWLASIGDRQGYVPRHFVQ